MALYSAGRAFPRRWQSESPLQLVGAINANHALLANVRVTKQFISPAAVLPQALSGIPDPGISTLDDVLTDVRRITDVCDLPLLVDADIGFGPSAFNVVRTVKSPDQSRAAGCIRRPRSAQNAVVTARTKKSSQNRKWLIALKPRSMRTDENFVVMARTDALAVEGLESALDRAQAYIDAGADMLFPGSDYRAGNVSSVHRQNQRSGTGKHYRVR